MLEGNRMKPLLLARLLHYIMIKCYANTSGMAICWFAIVLCFLLGGPLWVYAIIQFKTCGNMFLNAWMWVAILMHNLVSCVHGFNARHHQPSLNDHTTGKIECIEHFRAIIWWPYGYIRPVLKHGPRSLTHVQVHKFFTIMHNESDCWHFCISSQPNDWDMIECEHIC